VNPHLVTCPHCRNQLQNDPSIAGRVVMCPSCKQQLQMPPQAAVPAMPAAPLVQVETSPSTRFSTSSYGRRRKQKSTTGLVTALLFVLVAAVGGGVAIWRLQFSESPPPQQLSQPSSVPPQIESEVEPTDSTAAAPSPTPNDSESNDPSIGESPPDRTAEPAKEMSPEEESQAILKSALDSWSFGDTEADFKQQHPGTIFFDEHFTLSTKLVRYEIRSSRTVGKLVEFAVTLVLQGSGGREVTESRVYVANRLPTGWRIVPKY
jgi:uncharacterized protein YbaR (Trm112 family)